MALFLKKVRLLGITTLLATTAVEQDMQMEVDVPILFIQGSDQLLNGILSIFKIIQCIGTGNRLNYTKYPVTLIKYSVYQDQEDSVASTYILLLWTNFEFFKILSPILNRQKSACTGWVMTISLPQYHAHGYDEDLDVFC